jgi:hypothetical protein
MVVKVLFALYAIVALSGVAATRQIHPIFPIGWTSHSVRLQSYELIVHLVMLLTSDLPVYAVPGVPVSRGVYLSATHTSSLGGGPVQG